MDFTRQMTLANPELFKDKAVTVIGAGGIGAMTTLLLAKCGFEHITCYDFDTLDMVNGPNQMLPIIRFPYPKSGSIYQYGRCKVHPLGDLVYEMTGMNITEESDRYVDQPLTEVVVSAVDSMAVRKQIWEAAKNEPTVAFLVDGRMGRESLAIYAVDLLSEENCASYEETLHEDSEAIEIPCTEKATIYTNAQIGSWITKEIVAWACGQPWKRVIRINMGAFVVVTE